MSNDLIETWQIHDRINRYLLAAIPDEALTGNLTGGKGRSVGEIIAHIHNVRLMWLKSASPELLKGLTRIEQNQATDRTALETALTHSGQAIAKLLDESIATGRIKGFKPHSTAFLGYLISHESHHCGEIEVALTLAGHKLDQKSGYGHWEWGVK